MGPAVCAILFPSVTFGLPTRLPVRLSMAPWIARKRRQRQTNYLPYLIWAGATIVATIASIAWQEDLVGFALTSGANGIAKSYWRSAEVLWRGRLHGVWEVQLV